MLYKLSMKYFNIIKIENWYFELFKIFASLAIMNALNHFILLDYSSLLKKDSLLN